METVGIHTEFIKLGQLLKLAGFADTGVQSKEWIAEGLVFVNGVCVTERGKKIRPGDLVLVKGIGEVQVTIELT